MASWHVLSGATRWGMCMTHPFPALLLAASDADGLVGSHPAGPKSHGHIRHIKGEVVTVCISCLDVHPKQLLRQQPQVPTSSSLEHVIVQQQRERSLRPELPGGGKRS
eukprot:6469698-Amphidinium_carterae.1